MFASCCLKTWNEIAGTPSTREIESGSRSRSTRVPRSARRTTMPLRLATTTSANALASLTLPSTRTIASSLVPVSRPTGMSALARCSAVRHVGRRQLVGAQALRVEVDPHLAHRQAADVDAGDAGRALEALPDDLVGEQRQLARAAVLAEQREIDRRLGVVAVEARDVGLLGIAREVRLHRRDLVAHVLHGAVHVGAELELDHRLAAPLEAVRADHLDAGDAVQRQLDRPGQLGLGGVGRGARIGDARRRRSAA